MKEYDEIQEQYINGDRYIYDKYGNLIAIEHSDGVTEYV